MQLTQFSDYALRTLIFLSLRQEQRSTISDIADAYQISHNHLMKVANKLVKSDYVNSVRGKSGGLRLVKPPNHIGVGEVIRDMEPDFAVVECFRTGGRCRLQHACKLADVMHQATAAFLAVLDSYTLADLIHNEQQLNRLLGLKIPAAEPDKTACNE